MDKFGAREVASGRKRLAIVLAPDLCVIGAAGPGTCRTGDNYSTVEHKDAVAETPRMGARAGEANTFHRAEGALVVCGADLWCRYNGEVSDCDVLLSRFSVNQ